MSKRKILLIGVGGWGNVHFNVIASHRNWTISSLADSNTDTLQKAAQAISLDNSHLFTDPLQAIDQAEYDAISIVARNPARVPILLKALDKGVPVLVEKPLVHSLDDLRKIYKSVKKSGARIMVAQNYRFDPQARRMAQFIQEKRSWGALNNICIEFVRTVRQFGDHYVMQLPEGIALGAEMCIHHYDLMRFLLGQNPTRIRATARRADFSPMKGWGSYDVWIDFPGPTFANYHADYDVAVDRTTWGGTWHMDFEVGSMTWYPYSDAKSPIQFHSPWTYRWPLQVDLKAAEKVFRFHLLEEVFAEFTRALDGDREPECSLRDNVQSLAMVFAVNKAAATGKTIEFPKFLKEVMSGCP